MSDAKTDAVFTALAHASRRRMLDLLAMRPGMTVKALTSHFECSRVMVLKHLKTLEEADLVISERAGRERRLYFNPIPIQLIYDRWTDQYSAFWASKLVDIKTRIESKLKAKEQRRA